MLSGLFPINTNSLISFQEQYSVLLHQGTTFKELLSLVFYRERAQLHKVTLIFTFIHQVRPDIWGCRYTFCRMQLGRQWTWDMTSWTLRNLCRLMYFVLVFWCFYCWMLLFLLFICHCGSTTTAEQEQQQHYTVTTIWIQTKRLHNLSTFILEFNFSITE